MNKREQQVLAEIERLQNIQKQHHNSMPQWQGASAGLALLFAEMANIQKRKETR